MAETIDDLTVNYEEDGVMLTKELDHEDGELTATQKVKRAGVAQRFADLIADMYDETTEYPGGDLQHVHTAVAR